MARAVFLDRDGVINEDVYYRQTGEWEAPLRAEDLPQASSVKPSIRCAHCNNSVTFFS